MDSGARSGTQSESLWAAASSHIRDSIGHARSIESVISRLAMRITRSVPDSERWQMASWLVVLCLVLAGTWPALRVVADIFGISFVTTREDEWVEAGVALICAICVVGVWELLRVARFQAARLARERSRSRALDEVVRLKADFNRMVAHELGSPLAAIRGYADMLTTHRLGEDQQAEAIAAIRTESAILNVLLTDVRAATGLETGNFVVEPRPVSLSSLLGGAAAFARTLPGDHALSTPIATADIVWADPERIGQVLRNLLTNAVKYSAAGTAIALRTARVGTRVRVEVVDHGVGIQPDDLDRIFLKFRRGSNTTGRKVDGFGLGLYISRYIVEEHGSRLTVTSTPGIGSTFAFELDVVIS